MSNQPDPRALYNRILYMHLPYGDPGQIAPEVVVEIAPEGDFIAFGEAMWRDLDGYIYVTGQYQSPDRPINCSSLSAIRIRARGPAKR